MLINNHDLITTAVDDFLREHEHAWLGMRFITVLGHILRYRHDNCSINVDYGKNHDFTVQDRHCIQQLFMRFACPAVPDFHDVSIHILLDGSILKCYANAIYLVRGENCWLSSEKIQLYHALVAQGHVLEQDHAAS